MTDLAVLGQDPRFPGGSRVQAEAFWRAAAELGRSPTLYWLSYRGLKTRSRPATPLVGEAVPGLLPGLDGLNQLVAARRVAKRVRSARSVWAVSTVATHGYGAVLSGRRYGIWVGTTLDDEWSARRSGLRTTRRAALSLSARTLRRLERGTLRGARFVYATSPASKLAVARAGGLPPEEIGLLPIPVDTSVFTPATDESWRKGLERPTFVFVGRGDDPRKNLPLLLEAFDVVRRRLPDSRLLLVGPPPARVAAGIPAVEVTGEVSDLAGLLRRATIFVLPSLQEGFGIVAAEALASGLPVVTTPSRGPEDLVRGSGGGCVLEGFDAEELAATVVELIEHPDVLATMRTDGRAYVEREHALSRFRDRLEVALRDVDAP